MKVVPAMDLMGGQAVRLREGKREQRTDYSRVDPVATIARFAEAGAELVHLVDLDGAFAGEPAQAAVVARILGSAPVPVQLGGGMRSLGAVERALGAGAGLVVLGTMAVKEPELAEEACATWPGRIVVAVDARDGMVAVNGWTETTSIAAVDLAKRAADWGAAKILYTDVARDGTGNGPSLESTRELQRSVGDTPVIASGGIGSLGDIRALASAGIAECVVGRALYEGAFTVGEAIASGRTLTRRIIPCLDVKDGRVVKGVSFQDLRDAGDPVEQAALYDAQGADEICFLDITASSDNRDTILDVVSRTAGEIFVPLTVGGGVRTTDDVRRLLLAGADKVAMNTAAVNNPQLIADSAARFGAQAIVVAVDARREGEGWRVYVHGGRTATELDAARWCQRAADLGAGEILLTSMDRDGTRSGYDDALLRRVCTSVAIPVVASGGVGTLQHLAEGLAAGADAVLAASIFHYGEHTVGEAKEFLAAKGLPVRAA